MYQYDNRLCTNIITDAYYFMPGEKKKKEALFNGQVSELGINFFIFYSFWLGHMMIMRDFLLD